jgi:hypothetical protein
MSDLQLWKFAVPQIKLIPSSIQVTVKPNAVSPFIIIFNEEKECKFQLLLSTHYITRDIPILLNFCYNQFLQSLNVCTTNSFLKSKLG